MSIYLVAFLLGGLTGLRALTPIAVISWAASLGRLHLQNTWLAFLGATITPYIFSVLALVELITDKLPSTPSRKLPMPFGVRILLGAFCGVALAVPGQAWVGALLAGAIGAVVGTLIGAELRSRLASAVGKDLPIALLEDLVAIGGALLVVWRLA